MNKILYLTLHRKWFDQILKGIKKVEYRDRKKYWTDRLFNKDGSVKLYDSILFINGYGLDRPMIKVEFLGVMEKDNKYEILLGKVLEVINV